MAELVMIITTPTPVLVWRGSQESIAKVSTEERFCLIRVRRLHSSFIRNINGWNQAWTTLNHAKQSQRKLLINSLLTRSFQLNAHNITHWQDLEPLCRAEQRYHQNILWILCSMTSISLTAVPKKPLLRVIANSTRESASYSASHFPIRTKKIIWIVEPC